MENNVIILLLLIPFVIAILNMMLPSVIQKILTFLGIGFTLILTYYLYQGVVDPIYLFGEKIFRADEMSAFAITFIQLLSFIILIFSLKGITKEKERTFFVLYPVTVAFCNAVVLSDHAFAFLIFWGLSGLTLYLFGLMGTTLDAPKTSKKTFIIIGGSDVLLIMGLVMMWLIPTEKTWLLSETSIPLTDSFSYLAFFFLLIAAFAKAGGFPFHTWVPDFSKDAPVESAAFLPASLDKLLGIYLLTRMMTGLFELPLLINMIVVTLGAITIITAVMMAMVQHNGRKLLGYHAVSQVGYMIMGIGSGSVLAFAGGLFHLINHTIYKSNLFLTFGSVEKQTKTAELDYLGGLGKKMPVTFVMALIGALSISGIPPFNGFFSKWMIYQGLIEQTATFAPGYQLWMILCLILAVFGSALTLASFMKFLHAIYLGKRPEIHNNVKEAPANQWIATGLLSLLCLGFGIFALEGPLKNFIYPAVTSLGMEQPQFFGLYNPQLIVIMFLIGFILGLGIFLLVRKVRYDEIYVGGLPAMEKFRIVGTEFYNEIRNMTFLKNMYEYAEKKYFDIYDVGSKSTFAASRIFQRGHPGQLQLYLLYIIIGLVIFLAIL